MGPAAALVATSFSLRISMCDIPVFNFHVFNFHSFRFAPLNPTRDLELQRAVQDAKFDERLKC
jgi:hypothetical protein